jgi:hypothetical protein
LQSEVAAYDGAHRVRRGEMARLPKVERPKVETLVADMKYLFDVANTLPWLS